MDVIEQIAYHAAMLYGLASVAVAWAWGQRRGVSDFSLMAFGIALPTAGWLFSLDPSRSWTAALSPVCCGFLWYGAAGREELADRELDRVDDREFASAESRLAAAPDDGSAMLTLARLLEARGRRDEALRYYEAAHRASDRMFTALNLSEARERLAHGPEGPRPAVAAAELRPADWIAFAVGAALLFWSPLRGAAVLSTTAFARWLRAGAPPRPGPRLT
jgi:tetratricopeptide (TPR) repeat protein